MTPVPGVATTMSVVTRNVAVTAAPGRDGAGPGRTNTSSDHRSIPAAGAGATHRRYRKGDKPFRSDQPERRHTVIAGTAKGGDCASPDALAHARTGRRVDRLYLD